MKIGVIGGGASGLVAAISTKTQNNEVILFERNNEVGKKILATGNGKCNYWNEDQALYHYESSNEELIKQIINEKTEKQVQDFFNNLGILPKIKNGYYYPNTNQASTIKNLLEEERINKNIILKNNYYVEKIDYKNNKFIINKEIEVDKLIIATGGYASPKTGSTGMGYEFLKRMGHTIRKPLPSLVQCNTKKGNYLKEWKGIRTDVVVSLLEDNKLIRKEQGEIQLTDYGISGICVFNLSNRIARGLDNNKKEIVEIDFLPMLEKETLKEHLKKDKKISRILEGLLNSKLINILSSTVKEEYFINLDTNKQEELINNIKSFKVEVISTKGFEDAQVTSGGVILEEINLQTMESKKIKNLYIIGEVLDITGDCGGYNLGICFRTALSAGNAIRGDIDA